MFSKITKETMFKPNLGASARNYQKFFTTTKCISRWWTTASIGFILLGGYGVYTELPKKFKFENVFSGGLVFIAAGIILLIILALQQKRNFKGMLIDVEADCRPDIHYKVEAVSNDEKLARIAVCYPKVKCSAAWTESWKIEQMAKEFGIKFAPGVVFGIRDDGTFFFVHPTALKDQQKEDKQ